MQEVKAIIKLNGGRGALLCNGCNVILSYGSDHNTKTEHYCGECYRGETPVENDEWINDKLIIRALNGETLTTPPIWMMRQAGTVSAFLHGNKAETYNFEQMCKLPRVAADVAMLPIKQFDFDAAILFSDILWHVEGLGIPCEV